MDYASWDDAKFRHHGVILNDYDCMMDAIMRPDQEGYAFTLHEIFYEDDIFKQTRSSPNWQGSIATMATCKQMMRTWNDPQEWLGMWNFCFTPSHCASNALFFAGRVCQTWESNYDYGVWAKENLPDDEYEAKLADYCPRGDIYTPRRELQGEERYDVENFDTPPGHTRSTETYSDGTPKWWKDIRYRMNGRRPPVLQYNPAFIFSYPVAWTKLPLGRATRKVTLEHFHKELHHGGPSV